MNLKKIFYNSILALKNVNRYGFLLILKSIFYEIYYSIKFKDFTFFSYDPNDNIETSYEDSKIKNMYSAPNIPTPFYFLELIKDYMKSQNFNDFNLIDLGCGSGRLIKYFDYNFNIKFLGIDFSKKIIEENKVKFNKDNYRFYNLDLKKIENKSDLDLIDNSFPNYKKNVVFISDSIDALSIKKIIPIFKTKFGYYLFIMVNQKDIHLFENFNCKKNIFFKDVSRNISFFEI